MWQPPPRWQSLIQPGGCTLLSGLSGRAKRGPEWLIWTVGVGWGWGNHLPQILYRKHFQGLSFPKPSWASTPDFLRAAWTVREHGVQPSCSQPCCSADPENLCLLHCSFFPCGLAQHSSQKEGQREEGCFLWSLPKSRTLDSVVENLFSMWTWEFGTFLGPVWGLTHCRWPWKLRWPCPGTKGSCSFSLPWQCPTPHTSHKGEENLGLQYTESPRWPGSSLQVESYSHSNLGLPRPSCQAPNPWEGLHESREKAPL